MPSQLFRSKVRNNCEDFAQIVDSVLRTCLLLTNRAVLRTQPFAADELGGLKRGHAYHVDDVVDIAAT